MLTLVDGRWVFLERKDIPIKPGRMKKKGKGKPKKPSKSVYTISGGRPESNRKRF